MNTFKSVTILLVISYSPSAFAYLDPGSGSAIVSVITATIGSLWYFLKSTFYRFVGNNDDKSILISKDKSLVVFNEGKAYWGTFRPLIDALIKEKVPFRYITLDLHDPALLIENEYMESKRLSLNLFSLAELNKITASVMISTTPNIGTEGYPITKPVGVKNLVHVFHHVGDISIYKKNSLDHYDSVILVGDFQKKSIRDIEKLRNLKRKKLVSLGLLYLDDLFKNLPTSTYASDNRQTILIGSSWGNKGCLRTYGTEFINTLVKAGFRIIIRPHPQSSISEPAFIEQCKRDTKNSNVTWDSNVSPSYAMHQSQLLISDTSSLRFDYAFLYEKPIITLEIPRDNLTEFEAIDLDEHWHEAAAYKIGIVTNSDTIKNIANIVRDALQISSSTDLQTFRQETVANYGDCAPSIVQYINELNTEGELEL